MSNAPIIAPIIIWFRRDLRIADNPALSEAAATGRPLICLYILETEKERELGGASQWWLHHSLQSLSDDLESIGAKLILRRGQAFRLLDMLIEDTGAEGVYWNRRYDLDPRETDAAIKADLTERGLTVKSFRANLLSEPWTIKTKGGDNYYKVFTPYWRMAQESIDTSAPLPSPKSVNQYKGELKSESLDALALLPTSPDWAAKMAPHWSIGSKGAGKALEQFLSGRVGDYPEDRDRPDREGTSKLSPHLAFGEISPKQIWHGCKGDLDKARKFLAEIGWREFSYVLLYHNPKLASENFKPAFDTFEWNSDTEHLHRWQHGQTGYPFVDAGMRQLWQTGWQHNRVRMVTASFLIKHLLIDWREGEKWFHDTLVDADPASNAASWQWVAGSGADASPYFRIFNPFTQGEKFDPNGDYVRKFVPELKDMPKKYIHRPWDAPEEVLSKAGVKLGETYPKPIVDHKEARERALAAYKATRE